MSTVSLYIGMSLDGYIADENGGVDWMLGDGSEPDHPGTYEPFLSTVDTVIMGRRTYDQISQVLSPDSWPYPDQTTYVLTSHPLPDQEKIFFREQTLASLLKELKTNSDQHIWLCGGANLVQQAVNADLIDIYYLSVIPIILGQGIPLFSAQGQVPLKLLQTKSYNGIVDLVYERR